MLPTILKSAPAAPVPPPADPAEAFAQQAPLLLGTQLIAGTERFPNGQSDAILVVVVERDAAVWRERLRAVHEKLFGSRPSASPENRRFEVIDRSTDEVVRRLCDSILGSCKSKSVRRGTFIRQ